MNNNVKYPELCSYCSINLSRGKYKFTNCPICLKLSFHLGICAYS